MNAEQLLGLIDGIHAGATCDRQRAVSVTALSEAFGDAAVMLTRQAGAMIEDLDHAAWPEPSLELCCGPYCDPQVNEVLRTAAVVPIGLPLRPRVEDDGTFERSALYQEAMRPFGLEHPIGALLARSPRDVSFVSVMGYKSAKPFTAEDAALLARLIPALTSADRVRRLLVEAAEGRRLLERALDGLDRPVLIVDEQVRLRYANARAAAALDGGRVLELRAGRLVAVDGGIEPLKAAVAAAVAPTAAATALSLDGSPDPLAILRVEPLRAGENGVSRPLALLAGRPRGGWDDPLRLRDVYGLTRREAEVLADFVAGLGPTEIAARSGRSRNTIKVEAQAIYLKLGVGSFAQAAARVRRDLG